MDPMTWPMWAKVLAGWGPLGVWAGIMTYAYLTSSRRHETAMAKQTERHEAALTDQAKRFAGVVGVSAREAQDREDKLHVEHRAELVRLAECFAYETREAAVRHGAQEDELTDRLLATSEKNNETTRAMAERLAALAESMKRRHKDVGGDDGTAP